MGHNRLQKIAAKLEKSGAGALMQGGMGNIPNRPIENPYAARGSNPFSATMSNLTPAPAPSTNPYQQMWQGVQNQLSGLQQGAQQTWQGMAQQAQPALAQLGQMFNPTNWRPAPAPAAAPQAAPTAPAMSRAPMQSTLPLRPDTTVPAVFQPGSAALQEAALDQGATNLQQTSGITPGNVNILPEETMAALEPENVRNARLEAEQIGPQMLESQPAPQVRKIPFLGPEDQVDVPNVPQLSKQMLADAYRPDMSAGTLADSQISPFSDSVNQLVDQYRDTGQWDNSLWQQLQNDVESRDMLDNERSLVNQWVLNQLYQGADPAAAGRSRREFMAPYQAPPQQEARMRVPAQPRRVTSGRGPGISTSFG